jgi:hypothetical protein
MKHTNNVQILSSSSDNVVSIDLVVILYRKNNLLSNNFAMVELSWQYKIYEDCKHYTISYIAMQINVSPST